MHNRLGRVTLALSLACTLTLGLFLGLGQHSVQAESPERPLVVTTRHRHHLHPSAISIPPQVKMGEPSASVSDLSIHFISRMPRYERYCLDYTNDVPQLCEGTANAKRFPDPGEPVTFTARIANQGVVTTTPTAYSWFLDGEEQAVGVLPLVGPGAEHELSWNWAWQSGAHTVTLQIERVPTELTIVNNSLDHQTDAHYLEVLVHPHFVRGLLRLP